MKYLKTYEGVFDIFYSGNKIARQYIDMFKYQRLNFNILQDIQYPDGYSGGESIYTYTVSIDDNTVLDISNHSIEDNFGKDKSTYKLSINGRKVSASKDSLETIYIMVNHIYRKTDHIVGRIYTILQPSSFRRHKTVQSISEMRERCIEFELTKDYNSLDSISLNQIFDYYGEEYYEPLCDRLNKELRNYRTL